MSKQRTMDELYSALHNAVEELTRLGILDIEVPLEREISIQPETLELIYQESTRAHTALLHDLELLTQRADRMVQFSFLAIGVTVPLVALTNALEISISALTVVMILVGIVGLMGNAGLVILRFLPDKDYFAGTKFPAKLKEDVNTDVDAVKYELVSIIAKSYNYNYQQFLEMGRDVSKFSRRQFYALCFLVAGIALEFARFINLL